MLCEDQNSNPRFTISTIDSGSLVIMTSVVSLRLARSETLWSAERVTLVGSMISAMHRVTHYFFPLITGSKRLSSVNTSIFEILANFISG